MSDQCKASASPRRNPVFTILHRYLVLSKMPVLACTPKLVHPALAIVRGE
jgi:hypothetical protein